MEKQQVLDKLRSILDRADMDCDSIISRKKSVKHSCDTEVLLEHLAILVADLRFDAIASKRELFEVRKILEE